MIKRKKKRDEFAVRDSEKGRETQWRAGGLLHSSGWHRNGTPFFSLTRSLAIDKHDGIQTRLDKKKAYFCWRVNFPLNLAATQSSPLHPFPFLPLPSPPLLPTSSSIWRPFSKQARKTRFSNSFSASRFLGIPSRPANPPLILHTFDVSPMFPRRKSRGATLIYYPWTGFYFSILKHYHRRQHKNNNSADTET